MKAVLGSGATTVVSSDGFYIDDTPPIFDPEVMGGDIYIDVDQGEFTPVRYQGSNSTIKAFWRCFDEESDVVVSFPDVIKMALIFALVSQSKLKLEFCYPFNII